MREEGYYWVKRYDKWIIARWHLYYDMYCWEIPADDSLLDDHHFQEIDERMIKRKAAINLIT